MDAMQAVNLDIHLVSTEPELTYGRDASCSPRLMPNSDFTHSIRANIWTQHGHHLNSLHPRTRP